jgi:myo-inositol-1(or 4)-monophosphatase
MREFLQAAEYAARLAGQVLRSWSSRFTVREKSRSNLVTEADLASQTAIADLLSRRFPQHGLLGEEELAHGGLEAEYCWIIDPLDGTTNYVHGFPYYAISIGLEHRGEMIAGAIFDPVRDELFLGSKGGGATLNRRPLKCSDIQSLSEAMLIASLPVATESSDVAVQRFLKILPRAQTVQRTGSAALNLAYLAAGRLEGFWSSSLKPWDMAAGVLLVTEAGGKVTQVNGGEFQLRQANLLATNGGALHAELCNLLSH